MIRSEYFGQYVKLSFCLWWLGSRIPAYLRQTPVSRVTLVVRSRICPAEAKNFFGPPTQIPTEIQVTSQLSHAKMNGFASPYAALRDFWQGLDGLRPMIRARRGAGRLLINAW